MSHLISKRAAARNPVHFGTLDTTNAPEGFEAHPKPLPLHWGMPNNGFFPIELIDISVVDYPFQKQLGVPVTNTSSEALPGPDHQVDQALRKLQINDLRGKGKSRITIPRLAENPKLIDIKTGLQYSEVEGIPQLRTFTKDFIKRVHPPAYSDFDTIITNGAGDGLNKAADALLDPGDVILIEEFTFTPFLLNVQNAGAVPVPIKLTFDAVPGASNGLDLDYLTDLLENWDLRRPELKGKRPKALYTIPTGQNPSGLTQTLEFRKKVYALAERYDFGIIEDDPYGYLTLPAYSKPEGFLKLDEFLTVDEYLKEHLTPSYLQIDVSGRVLRIETFSKLFAPGLRLGFIVAHKKVVQAVARYSAVVTRSASGASQLIVNNVIEQSFGGIEGWLNWVLKMRVTYTHRRNVLLHELYESQAYKDGHIDVIDPRAGMFVSLLVRFPKGTNVVDKIKLLTWKFTAYGVGVVPGINMAIDKEFSKDNASFFRLTYAPATSDEDIIEATARLTTAVKDFFAKGLEF